MCVCKRACAHPVLSRFISKYLISRQIFLSLSFSRLTLFAHINSTLLCSFLAKRGVREDIATFEARNITPEIRQSVEELLNRNTASFDPKVPLAGRRAARRTKRSVFFSHRVRLILPCSSECETCKRSSCSPGRLGESQRPVLPRSGADRAPGERAGRTARVGAPNSNKFSLVPPHTSPSVFTAAAEVHWSSSMFPFRLILPDQSFHRCS